MKLVSLDLEMNQPSERIIQIGTAYVDLSDRTCHEGISILVNPYEMITPEIEALTGVTNERIESSGLPMSEAYDEMVKWVDSLGTDVFINPITWGGGDSMLLQEQVGAVDRWVFGRRWIDIKTVFVFTRMALGENHQSGLAKSLTRLGMAFEGRKHDAADDAFNTGKIYLKLMEDLNI